ncbi:MAG: DUF488 family protein [Candidatus Limnocylindrales bacterium]
MALYTSYYAAGNLIVARGVAPVRISIGAPRFRTPYQIAGACRLLMPRRDMLGLPYDDYEGEYLAILDGHGADAIRSDLDRIAESADGRPLALLCFENLAAGKWCHRRIFADWWVEQTGESIDELDATTGPTLF